MIRLSDSPRRATLILASALTLLTGCGQFSQGRTKEHASARILNTGTAAKVSKRQAADVQIALARTLEESQQLAEAEAAYRDAIKNDPRRADAHARLAVLFDRRGDFKAAATQFAEAIRLDPRNPDYPCDRGYSLYVQGRWAEAEASLRQAIALDARHPRSHNNLGLVLARQAHNGEALAEFQRAGCDPSDARSNLGLILAEEGRFADSKAAYAKALELKPSSAVALEGLHAATAASTRDAADTKALARSTPKSSRKDDSLLRTSVEIPR